MTEQNLVTLEKRLNDGYTRSIQKKAQVINHAKESIQKIEDVLSSQKRQEEDFESERL